MSHALTALSPLDGRYASKTRALQEHFSEFALVRHRVRVEIAWLKALADEPGFALLPPFSPATVCSWSDPPPAPCIMPSASAVRWSRGW